MQKGDVQVFRPFSWSLVNQAYSFFAYFRQCVGHSVLDAEGHVVHAMVSLVEPFLDGAFRGCRFKEFDFYFSTLQKGGFHLLVFHNFGGIALQAQHVSEERQAFFDVLDSDAQMLNV